MRKIALATGAYLRRAMVACAMLAVLAAEAAPTLTYYSHGVEETKSSWTSDASDTAAGWEYDLKALDTDTLKLYGEGASYKLSGTVSSDFSVIVEKSCTLTLEGYSASNSQSPIVVSDGATLTLLIGEGTSSLTGATTGTHGNHAGIEVQPGGTLIIDKVEGASDEACILNAKGGNDSAAIGANDNSSCGNIVINGGTINAESGDEAAGIGGGNINTSGDFTIGTITINGGIVTAKGRDRGAGIGVGLVQHSCTVTAEGIYINGGVVNASDMNDGRAAGIGTGEVSQGTVTVNEIVITGGTVTASSYKGKDNSALVPQEAAGAGIGTGIIETGGQATITKIEISGGDVTATGAARGAGIGTGEVYLGNSAATIGSIEISGGNVTAVGGDEAAGIGTGVSHGASGNASAEVTAIEISGGTVTATKGANANGSDIGSATSNKGNSTGTTTMNSVKVTGGSIAPGTTLTNPSNGVNSNLCTLTVPGNWSEGEEIEIVGLGAYGTNDIFADENGNIYLFVPEGEYVFNANGRLFEATVQSEGPNEAGYAAATGMTIDGVDIAYGNGTGWFYDGDTLSIETNATLTVSGESRLPVELLLDDGADVTLYDVEIVGASGIPAVTTTGGANVTLRLDGDNVLEGGSGAAAVQPGVGATITILDGAEDGIGQLTADGGAGAAAIGAGASTACGNVTIAGGHIKAYGGTDAAGIGAGSGSDASCGTITVSGGTVEAEHGGSTIHGGTTGADVGDGVGGACAGVVVTGGSLVADHGTVDPSPTGLGNEAGHAVNVQNDSWVVGEPVEISGMPDGYGTNDIVAAENKNVVVWLPDGDYPLEVNGDWYVVSVDGGDGTAVPATLVDVPSPVDAAGLVYTGSPITGVPEGEGYTITGNVETEPGHYVATVTPAEGCLWSDHTMAPVQVEWYIAPAVIDSQYGTVTYDDVNIAWVVTVTNDIPGVLEIPDTLGNVVFDLNGHDIVGADGDDTDPNGGAAVHIVHADDGTGVNVSFVDSSGNGSSIVGGNGADGTADHPAGGNGGPGILIDDNANSPSVTVGENVSVVGGNGGSALAGSGANGGNGGAGVQDASGTGIGTPLDSSLDNGGTIAGGNGGDGAGSESGNGGNGGNGGAGVDGHMDGNAGSVTGGDAGNGGSSLTGTGGAGGNGGTGVNGNVGENDGSITGGNAGNGGDGVTAGAGGTGGAASTGTIGDSNEQPGTTGNGGSGTSGSVTPSVDPNGGATWLDGSPLRMVAIVPGGENVELAFSVPLQPGLGFATWVDRSVANHKLAVVVADSLAAMTGIELTTLLNGGTYEGVKVIYVGTAACSSSAAEYVSSDATAKTMTIRVPKALQSMGFYRVCVLKD